VRRVKNEDKDRESASEGGAKPRSLFVVLVGGAEQEKENCLSGEEEGGRTVLLQSQEARDEGPESTPRKGGPGKNSLASREGKQQEVRVNLECLKYRRAQIGGRSEPFPEQREVFERSAESGGRRGKGDF